MKAGSLNLAAVYQRISTAIAILALLIGVAACLCVMCHLTSLTALNRMPATAYLSAGAALLLLNARRKVFLKRAGLALAVFLGIYSVVELFNATFNGSSSGLFSQYPLVSSFTSVFGSMGASDSVGFILVGLALICLDARVKTKLKPSEFFSSSAMMVALLTLLGVFFGVPGFCFLISCLKISVENASAYAVLCLGVLLARPETGAISILSSKYAGGMSARRLIPAAIAFPIILGAMKAAGQSAHLLDGESGLTIIIATMIASFLLLIWFNSTSLDTMDANQQRFAERLEQSERLATAIVQQSIDAFIGITLHGKVCRWNQQAERIFGFSPEEAMHKPIWQLIMADKESPQYLTLLETYKTGATLPDRPVELLAVHKTGREFYIEISAFYVQSQQEQLICAFVRDITEKKQIQAQFRDFYFTVSHELRSPLMSVQGSLHLIKRDEDTELSERSERCVQTADQSCDRLIKLINDLLDVKRIEAGKLRMNLAPVSPQQLIEFSMQNLDGIASTQGIAIKLDIQTKSQVNADSDRVVQVLTNLLSNAFKFSPKGSAVTVSIEETNDGFIKFGILDCGPGIAEEDRNRLFAKFEQADAKPSFRHMGTGLGLAISKAIIKEHGGSIGADSTLGAGSKFWFTLPAVEPIKERISVQTLPEGSTELAQRA